MKPHNVDPIEIEKFSKNAIHWWDTQGEFKPLHDINPLRLNYIKKNATLNKQKVIDIGCGGGILTESMALAGASVTGIDMSAAAIGVANLRQLETKTDIEYVVTTAEAIAAERPEEYDIVTCLEMLEHVPDAASIIKACATLVKPGGKVFFSTLNRNLKSYVSAIIGAEYILQLLPKNTHDYAKFIRPSELAEWSRATGLNLLGMTGITYNIFTKHYKLTDDCSVNYLAYFVKQG
ncbi:MAG: bifunctional 2-polyprenyl-6-hydroxyphenol methylase/3-demethylubiquinol 3-O-methyltransferase UbiG [Gammaproteobacteria bacterium]|nr:bifunctional 2-polyprenyl-6-hydroxyphenol methylase/3-demethylubiquinol 3-O-methyltransferase UbiG [Gammaproteobacteria bacterium]